MPTLPHRPTFSAFPLAVLAAALASGVLLARPSSVPLAVCVTLTALASTLALFASLKAKHAFASRLVVAAFVFAGSLLASVEARSERSETLLRSFYERGLVVRGQPVELTGVLERAPEIAPDALVLSLRVEGLRYKSEEQPCAGRVELYAPVRGARGANEYESLELRRGARLRLMTALADEERYRNPGVISSNELLESRDLDARGTVKSPLLVERLDDEPVFLPLAWLDRWRARLIRLTDATFSADTAGVVKAALLGNRYGLSRDTAERFRDGGTFHVLVISGLHITFLGGLVWAAARRFTRSRAWQWVVAVACVWTYAVGVGAHQSVVRASLMFTLAALAPVFGRRSSPLNALGGAALALLIWRPLDLFDPSFQLTFLSVGGLIALALPLLSNLRAVGEWRPVSATPYPPACPRWFQTLAEILYWRERRWRRETAGAAHSYNLFKTPWAARLERWRIQPLVRFAFAAILLSLVVQIAILPLLVLYFHRVSIASPLLNVFVGAALAALAFTSFAALALSQLGHTLAVPLVQLAEKISTLMTHGVDPFAHAHAASLRLPEYVGAASAVYVLYFAPLLVFAYALLRWRPLGGAGYAATALGEYAEADENAERGVRVLKFAAFALAASLVVIVAHPLSAGGAEGRLRVDFLDVGQGDAALVTMPDGSTLLVDGGGRPDFRQGRGDEDGTEEFEPDSRGVGEAVVSEYLWWRGLAQVDYVLATHADADHIEGLGAIVKNFRVEGALVARAPSDNAEFVRFATSAQEAGVPVYVVGRGDRLSFGAVKADVLWPLPAQGGADLPSGNNDSIILRLRFGRRTFLLTGDAESDAERALVASGDDLSADVLKVAHHGSRTSSTEAFVTATRPMLAVVSVGRDSPYGHPHPEVLERWRASGALVLTTGDRGMITVSTDGEDMKVETFVKE